MRNQRMSEHFIIAYDVLHRLQLVSLNVNIFMLLWYFVSRPLKFISYESMRWDVSPDIETGPTSSSAWLKPYAYTHPSPNPNQRWISVHPFAPERTKTLHVLSFDSFVSSSHWPTQWYASVSFNCSLGDHKCDSIYLQLVFLCDSVDQYFEPIPTTGLLLSWEIW